MNILIIAYYYPPINSGGTMRPLKMAKYLSQMGHDVTVLTHTYGKSKTVAGNPCVKRFSDISHNRDRVGLRRRLQWFGLRAWTELLNRLGFYWSIYSWWKDKVIGHSAEFMKSIKPDVIVATYPPVETLEIGLYLSKTYHIPLIVDFRDGLIFEPIETKRMKKYHCIMEEYQRIEREAVQQAVAVTTIAKPITDYYVEKYHPPFAEVISNGFDPEDLQDLPQDIQLDPSCFNIVFTGRFGLSDRCNRVDYFFDAVRQLLDQQNVGADTLKIHLVGEYGTEELRVLKDLLDRGVVLHHGFVERSRALAFQRAADLLLIITLPDRKSSVSAKIFEYLYAGKPILALTYQTVLADIIHETRAGWVVHPQKPNDIAELLHRILTEPGFYDSFNPDWQAIRQYSSETQMEKFHHLLQKIITRNTI